MGVDASTLDLVARLVKRHAAIVLDASKDYLVESRLRPVARSLGLGSVDELARLLQERESPALVTQVVDAMTTNETTFFRDARPFEALRAHILPALVGRRRGRRALRIWSAASSTGQEPYSIAMLLAEHFPELDDWDVSILATDISSQALARARAGKYHQLEVNRGLPPRYLGKYFERDELSWVLRESVKRRVEFRAMNLAATWPALPTMDVVLLRNVLIYFDAETRRSVLGKARAKLARDGYLFVGSTETPVNIDSSFVRAPFERSSCYLPGPGSTP